VRVHAALENNCISRSIKEPCRDTQGANPIACVPSSADLIGLAMAGHDLTWGLARPNQKFEGKRTSSMRALLQDRADFKKIKMVTLTPLGP